MRHLAISLLTVLVALPVFAGDGRVEINQASVVEAGGFPYTINAPGSYVLTSDLIVSVDVTAISIATNDVTLDLNGFRIAGPHSCSVASCPIGIGSGVGTPPLVGGRRVSVFGGQVSGFGARCIVLGSEARVERMTVFECGQNGIAVGSGSSVIQNNVFLVGRHGILLQPGAAYAHNVVGNVGFTSTGQSAIKFGTAIAGNYCEDGSCKAVLSRRFYLSKSEYTGATAPTGCATGFHMGSVPELLASDSLAYDAELGETTLDSGSGLPVGIVSLGWARTGLTFDVGSCNAYTSDTGTGTVAFPGLNETPDLGATLVEVVWRTVLGTDCSAGNPVWCVED